MLHNLDLTLHSLENQPPNSFKKDYSKAILKELHKRFPELGKTVDVYVFAHILHPFFRGTILRNYDGIWSKWIDELIKQNEETPEDDVQVNVNVAVSEADEEEEDDDGLGTVSKLTQRMATQAEQEGASDRRMTPLAVELDKYVALPRLDTHKIDVLAWWKAQQHSFPLLAQCARKYLCIPASSAPSERLFSTSGSLVTAKRNCLSPRSVEMTNSRGGGTLIFAKKKTFIVKERITYNSKIVMSSLFMMII